MTASWNSYPKVWTVGHPSVRDLLNEPVVVQEKLDGSQFSFGVFDTEHGTELKCRSKGAILNLEAPEKMFAPAVAYVQSIVGRLQRGYTYRAEWLAKPKHGTLAYGRVPTNGLALFDVAVGLEDYINDESELALVAHSLGIEPVASMGTRTISTPDELRDLLQTDSMLGGCKVEGVVLKNRKRFGPDGKPLMAKFVSEAFKEIHGGEWREANPTQGDIIQLIINRYRTPARWAKAVQHMAETGQLEHSPRDIGKLMAEVQRDTWEECGAEISEMLLKFARSKITRALPAGLPEWYKEQLLKRQFETGPKP